MLCFNAARSVEGEKCSGWSDLRGRTAAGGLHATKASAGACDSVVRTT